jgi:hypothetical protein
MKIEIKKIIGENCITLDDGTKIYDIIYPELVRDQTIELDFKDVKVFATPFFNAAIGQLLKNNAPEKLNRLLFISNLIPAGMISVKKVIDNAKQYYTDPNIKRATDDVITEQSKDK